MKKDTVEATLRAFWKNLFKTLEEKAAHTYGIDGVLNRSTKEIRANREANSHAQYVEYIIEEEIVDPEWEVAKENFIKWHYFWNVWRTEFEMKSFIAFMEQFYLTLWTRICHKAKKRAILIKPPSKTFLPIPTKIGTNHKDFGFLQKEVITCCKALRYGDNPTTEQIKELKEKVYRAYNEPPPKF